MLSGVGDVSSVLMLSMIMLVVMVLVFQVMWLMFSMDMHGVGVTGGVGDVFNGYGVRCDGVGVSGDVDEVGLKDPCVGLIV